jgi:hypothetical protein
MPNAILADEALRQRQSASYLAELRILPYEDVGKADARMVGRHVKGPKIFLDLHASTVRWHQKTGDPECIAVIA